MLESFVLEVKKYDVKKRKHESRFKCIYCDKKWVKKEEALKCVKDHKLIFVPLSIKDLGRLNQFLHLKENSLLTNSLVKIIQKYARAASKKE